MCFHSQQSKTAQNLMHRFSSIVKEKNAFEPQGYINGFTFPKTPVIANNSKNEIQLFHWGLIPFWAKDQSIRKYTLNAKIETLSQKPSFRQSIDKRCMVLVDGFYEWKWLDPKGVQKQKHFICLPDKEAFALGGIWSEWTNPSNRDIIYSYSIITTEANPLMSEIHNSKKRMPLILTKKNERDWLEGAPVEKFIKPDVELMAISS
jgi:putative SOS response-associated peptidase YedK